MRRTATITVMLWTVALAAVVAPGGVAARQGGDAPHPGVSLEAVADVRPVDGRSANGLVLLSGLSDGTAHARGVHVALLLPAVQKIRVAVSKKSCSQLTVPPIDIDLLGLEFVGGPLDVPSDGAVAWEHLVDLSLLRRARALAVVGDHDGDGDDDLGACGDLVMRRVAWTRDDERARGVFASAEQLGDAFAGGRLLAHAMVDPDGPDRLGAVFIDLAPSTQHRLALSPESCERLVGTDSGFEAPSRQLMTLMTDAQGTASVHAGGVNFGLGDGSVRSARSMVVGRPGADGPVLAACAPLRYGIVRGDPKP